MRRYGCADGSRSKLGQRGATWDYIWTRGAEGTEKRSNLMNLGRKFVFFLFF